MPMPSPVPRRRHKYQCETENLKFTKIHKHPVIQASEKILFLVNARKGEITLLSPYSVSISLTPRKAKISAHSQAGRQSFSSLFYNLRLTKVSWRLTHDSWRCSGEEVDEKSNLGKKQYVIFKQILQLDKLMTKYKGFLITHLRVWRPQWTERNSSLVL